MYYVLDVGDRAARNMCDGEFRSRKVPNGSMADDLRLEDRYESRRRRTEMRGVSCHSSNVEYHVTFDVSDLSKHTYELVPPATHCCVVARTVSVTA